MHHSNQTETMTNILIDGGALINRSEQSSIIANRECFVKDAVAEGDDSGMPEKQTVACKIAISSCRFMAWKSSSRTTEITHQIAQHTTRIPRSNTIMQKLKQTSCPADLSSSVLDRQ
jgi:hypothetical protein